MLTNLKDDSDAQNDYTVRKSHLRDAIKKALGRYMRLDKSVVDLEAPDADKIKVRRRRAMKQLKQLVKEYRLNRQTLEEQSILTGRSSGSEGHLNNMVKPAQKVGLFDKDLATEPERNFKFCSPEK